MPKVNKNIDRKRSIGLAAKELDVQTHVIRFWESKFPQIAPEIGKGNRRYYFDKDIEKLSKIKFFLYEEGYTINGLQKLLKTRKKSNQKEQDISLLVTENNLLNPDKDATQLSIFNKLSHDRLEIDRLIENIDSGLTRLACIINK